VPRATRKASETEAYGTEACGTEACGTEACGNGSMRNGSLRKRKPAERKPAETEACGNGSLRMKTSQSLKSDSKVAQTSPNNRAKSKNTVEIAENGDFNSIFSIFRPG
jgi:hypothetical protein